MSLDSKSITVELYSRFDKESKTRAIAKDLSDVVWAVFRQNRLNKLMTFKGGREELPDGRVRLYREAWKAFEILGNYLRGGHAGSSLGYYMVGQRDPAIPLGEEVQAFRQDVAVIHKSNGLWVVQSRIGLDTVETALASDSPRADYYRMLETLVMGYDWAIYAPIFRPRNGKEGALSFFLNNYQLPDDESSEDVLKHTKQAIENGQIQAVRTALTSAGQDPDHPTEKLAKQLMVNRYGFQGRINMHTVIPGTLCVFYMGDDDINSVPWYDPESEKGLPFAKAWKELSGSNSTIRVEVPESAIITK